MEKFTGVKLLEIPAFHIYIEAKGTRDIHIHNRGIANETYIRKVGSHARVKINQSMPISTDYFLQAYEACLQVTEALRDKFHDIWPSTDYESWKVDLVTEKRK